MNWKEFVFLFIPEAFLMVSFGLSLFHFPYRKNLHKIFLASLIYGLLILLMRSLPLPTEIRILLNIVLFLFTVWGLFRFTVFHAITIAISSSLLTLLTEYLSLLLASKVSGMSYQAMTDNWVTKISLPYIHFFLMALLTFAVYRSRFKLTDSLFAGRKAYIFFLVLIGLAQVLLVFSFTLVAQFLISSSESLFTIQGVPIYVIMNIVFVVLSFSVIKKWYDHEVRKSVEEAEDTYQKELRALITSMRSHRHDFNNHLQVVYGLIQIKAYQEAESYLQNLVQETKITNLSLSVRNKALAVLFHSKWMIAQAKQIEMKIEAEPGKYDLVPSTDLIRIYSNLIDNAFEATAKLSRDERKVRIKLRIFKSSYLFEIENTGPTIENTQQIFESGYSTNKSDDKPKRGYGLAIVSELVQKYQGDIEVFSQNNLTTIKVSLPIRDQAHVI
ncbi:hypothetical protein BSNK01_24320 [Bacillaceae bacterium]